jgi:hypothetical protein
MVQMMPQILAITTNNLPQNNLGSKEPRDEAKITLLACKICGEIGHLSEECQEQCHHSILATQLENVPWPMLLVSYAMESTMYPVNVNFTPRCNE